MTRRPSLFCLLLLWLLPLITSCMGQSSTANPIYYYTIDYEPQLNAYADPLPYVLQIHSFSVSPPFNSQRMIYADKGLHRNSYGYHQWIASPGELLPFVLARDLRHAAAVQTVLTPDMALPATHHLHGWVEKFVEQDNTHPRQAFVRLHITVVTATEPDVSRRMVLQKSYQAQAECSGSKPNDVAHAMSRAVARINQALIQDIRHTLSTLPSGNP